MYHAPNAGNVSPSYNQQQHVSAVGSDQGMYSTCHSFNALPPRGHTWRDVVVVVSGMQL